MALRNHEVQVGRAINPVEALANQELRLDLSHRMVLEDWLKRTFQALDAIAPHLLPTAKGLEIQAKQQKPVGRGRGRATPPGPFGEPRQPRLKQKKVSGDEDEVWEEARRTCGALGQKRRGGELGGNGCDSPPVMTGNERQLPAYWQAVISALSPEKQAAAWQFFQERELGLAKGATDTLSGLVLLLEANGLFMDACAKRLADTVTVLAPPDEREASAKILPVPESIPAESNNPTSRNANQSCRQRRPASCRGSSALDRNRTGSSRLVSCRDPGSGRRRTRGVDWR